MGRPIPTPIPIRYTYAYTYVHSLHSGLKTRKGSTAPRRGALPGRGAPPGLEAGALAEAGGAGMPLRKEERSRRGLLLKWQKW